MQSKSITRRFAAVFAVGLTAAAAAAAPAWREAPEHLALFTPAAQRQAYRADVTDAGLEEVLAAARSDAAAVTTPGAWTATAQGALDAFGRSGQYDRWALARVYGARQPRVARGARSRGGRVVETWTLVSPYPAADFSHLEPGTLRIILQVAR